MFEQKNLLKAWLVANKKNFEGKDLKTLLWFMDASIGIGPSNDDLEFYEIDVINELNYEPLDAIKKAIKGNFNISDEYIQFDEEGNFHTYSQQEVWDKHKEYENEIIEDFIKFVDSHDFDIEEFLNYYGGDLVMKYIK